MTTPKDHDYATHCEWLQDEDGCWGTNCNNEFEFTEGTPLENGFEWCPYCGKRMAETKWEETAAGIM